MVQLTTFYIHTLLYKSLLDTVQHQVITGIPQYKNITNYHHTTEVEMTTCAAYGMI